MELRACVCLCFGSVCLLIAGGSSQTRSNPDQWLISRHHPLPSPPYFHVFFFSFSPKILNILMLGIKTRRVSKSKMNNKRGGNCPWMICVSFHKCLRAALRSHSTSQRCCLPLLKFLSPFSQPLLWTLPNTLHAYKRNELRKKHRSLLDSSTVKKKKKKITEMQPHSALKIISLS